ncbi:MAG: ABC transporter permease [Pygmaiobacter massiliensis]|nr:ABC transporter permease [Pygmaiobacter massiliensis]
MRITDLVSLCFENLRRRKGRTALTVIGVMVGTCAIVVMVSLGIAMNVGFDEMIASYGDLTKITVYNWGGTDVKMDDKAVAQMQAMDHVTIATPIYTARYLSGQIFSGKNDRYAMQLYNVVGMYPEAIKALEYELISGEYLPDSGKSTAKKDTIQVLMGQYAGYGFTDTKKTGSNASRWQGQTDSHGNPLDPFVNVEKDKMLLRTSVQDETDTSLKKLEYNIQVCGVMKEDYQKGYVTSAGVIMDLNVLKRLENEYIKANKIKVTDTNNGYDQVVVKVDDIDNVQAVEEAIKELGFSTDSMNSWRESMQQQSQSIQMILGGLGAISLFVAALSIANTMTMAIYERTREIGVMKVLGCRLPKIRQMFLIEAGMIGFLGGLIGIAVSYTLSFLMNHFAPVLMSTGLGNILPMYGTKVSVIPIWLALAGLGFATVIGLLSGVMPANRAVKISALEAIRHE